MTPHNWITRLRLEKTVYTLDLKVTSNGRRCRFGFINDIGTFKRADWNRIPRVGIGRMLKFSRHSYGYNIREIDEPNGGKVL